jgi:hypothetical protein
MEYSQEVAAARVKAVGRVVSKISNPFDGILAAIVNVTALLVSWFFNKSILWGIFHYIFSGPYLLYSLVTGRFSDGGFMEIINSYF